MLKVEFHINNNIHDYCMVAYSKFPININSTNFINTSLPQKYMCIKKSWLDCDTTLICLSLLVTEKIDHFHESWTHLNLSLLPSLWHPSYQPTYKSLRAWVVYHHYYDTWMLSHATLAQGENPIHIPNTKDQQRYSKQYSTDSINLVESGSHQCSSHDVDKLWELSTVFSIPITLSI